MARVELHPEAIEELEASAEWYLERSAKAAQGFAISVERALQKVSDDPDRFPKVGSRHRACNLMKYPFQVVYRKEGDRVFVVAIAHAKRRPGYWRRRSGGTP